MKRTSFAVLGLALISISVRAQEDRREHFLPTDQLDAVFEQFPKGVMLPRDRYEELLKKAHSAAQTENIPTPVALNYVEYHLRQSGQQAVVQARLHFRQFTDNWTSWQIPVGNLTPESATIDGRPASVAFDNNTRVMTLFHKSAESFVLELTLSTPLGSAGSDRFTAFRLLPGVSSDVRVDCPPQRFLEVNNLKLKRPKSSDKSATYTIPAGDDAELRLRWTTELQESNMQTLIFVRSQSVARLSTDNLRWSSSSRVSVFGNAINQVIVRVPATLEVTNVRSTGLESWDLEDDPNNKSLTRVILNYRQPFSKDRLVELTAVTPVTEDRQQEVPALEFVDVTAHTGRIVVAHEDQLRLVAGTGDGIRHLGTSMGTNSLVAGEVFDYWLQLYRLRVAVRQRDRELFAQINSTLSIDDSEVRLASELTVEPLNAPLFQLPIQLPEHWQPDNIVDADSNPVKWRKGTIPDSIILEPERAIAPGELLTVNIELSRSIENPDEAQAIAAPSVRLLDGLTVGGTYEIGMTRDLIVEPEGLQGLFPIGNKDGLLLFELQGDTVLGQLIIRRKPVRLASRAVVRSWLNARSRSTELVITVDITNGRTRTLELSLPEEMGPDVRFKVRSIAQVPGFETQSVPDSVRITEQTVTGTADGRRTFQLTLDGRIAGALTLSAVITEESSESKMNAASVIVRGATRQHGLLVYDAFPNQQLTPTEAVGLSPVDAGLVPPADTTRGVRTALVYRFTDPSYKLVVQAEEYRTEKVPSAVCECIHNVTVVTDTGSIQRSSDMSIQCSGVQTLRFTLPENTSLWSTMLNEEPVEVRRDGKDYLVAVPTQQLQLKVLFAAEGGSTIEGTLRQEPIRLSISNSQGIQAGIEILERTWQIRYPDSSVIVEHIGRFEDLSKRSWTGWLQAAMDQTSIPSPKTAAERSAGVVIALAILALLTAIITRRRWKTLGLLTITGAVIGMVSLLQENTDNLAIVQQTSESASIDDYYTDDADFDNSEGRADYGGEKEEDAEASMPAPPNAAAGGKVMSGLDPFGNEKDAAEFNDLATTEKEAESPPVSDLPAEDNQSAERDREILNAVGSPLRTKTARLSVIASIVDPEQYSQRRYRSIGAVDDSTGLSVTIRRRTSLNALRFLSATGILLIGLWIRKRSTAARIAVILIPAVLALGAVPLLPGDYQPLIDGIVIGSLLCVILWLLLLAGCKLCSAVCQCCSVMGLRKVTTASAVLFLSGVVQAMPQEEQQQAKDSSIDIVVPYQPDRPAGLSDRVYLPHARFMELYRVANPDRLAARTPAKSGVVGAWYTSGDLRQVKEAIWSQSFTGRFVLRTYGVGPQTIAIPLGTVAVTSAVLNGEESLLTAIPETQEQQQQQQQEKKQSQTPAQQVGKSVPQPVQLPEYQVRVPDAEANEGLQILDVTFDVGVTQDKQVGHVSLPLSAVPVGTLSYALPDDALKARVNGRTSTFRQQGRMLTVPIAAGGSLRIDWQPGGESGQTETTYHSTVRSALHVNDSGLALNVDLDISVRQGALSELEVTLPDEYALQQVTGADIAGWNIIEGGSPRLKLVFREPVESQTAASLTLFRRDIFDTESATVAVPIPVVQGASRDSGYATVLAGTELDIRVNTLSGVTQINPTESQLPKAAEASVRRVLAWRYTRHPAQVAVRIQRTEDELKARILNGIQLETTRQLWTTEVTAMISGSPRRRLEVVMPADLVILDVAAQSLADWYLTDGPDDQTRILNIHLTRATRGQVIAVIQAQRGTAANDTPTKLSAPLLTGADEQQTHMSIWLDEATEFDSSQAEGWKRGTANRPVPRELLKLKIEPPALSLSSDRLQLSPIVLSLRQRQVTVTPESVTVTNVTDTSRNLTLGLNWRIDNAAREFSFSLPESLRGVFDFRIPGLRQLEESEPVDGRIQYTIHLQQPISKKFFVIGNGTLPLPEDGRVSVAPPEFNAASSQMTVASQSHFWVLVNQSSGLLSPENAGEQPGRDVLPADIEIPEGFMKQAVAVRRLGSGPAFAWTLDFPEQQAVSPAVIALAAHTTVIAEDGTWRSLHELQVRNEARQFLPIILPEKSRVLYCRVQDVPTRIVSRMQGENLIHLIPVPQSGQVAAPFAVDFAIAGRLDSGRLNINAQPVALPVPLFPEFRDYPDFGITVSRNTWRVYVPRKWQATINRDPRQTNVEEATEDALEDTKLLSVVDDARSIISYANSKATADNATLYREIENRQYVLEQQIGNTLEAEQQRADAIEQLEGLKQQIDVSEGNAAVMGHNYFLDNIDLNTNDFNNFNSADLLRRNINPRQADNTIKSGPFSFELPPEAAEQMQKSVDEFEKNVDKSKGGKAKGLPAKPELIDNRSQLLQQRESNLRKKSKELRNRDERKSTPPPVGPGNGPFGNNGQAGPADNAGGGFGGGVNFRGNLGQNGLPSKRNNKPLVGNDRGGAVDQAESDRAAGAALNPNPQSATEAPGQRLSGQVMDAERELFVTETVQGLTLESDGVLSLRFEIPQDGVHYDFVRTGGNARLTLDVRSRESLRSSFGLLWTASCLVAIIVLVNAESWRHLARRLCGVLVVGGLAGWLLLPMATATAALIVCLLAALTFSLVTVYSTFRPVPSDA